MKKAKIMRKSVRNHKSSKFEIEKKRTKSRMNDFFLEQTENVLLVIFISFGFQFSVFIIHKAILCVINYHIYCLCPFLSDNNDDSGEIQRETYVENHTFD